MICETCFGLGEVLIDKTGKVVSRLAGSRATGAMPRLWRFGFRLLLRRHLCAA